MVYFYVSLVSYFCNLILKYNFALGKLIESKFNLKKYNKWVSSNKLFNLELISLIVIVCAFNFNNKCAEITMLAIYMILFLFNLRKNTTKIKCDKKVILFIVLNIIFWLFVLLGFYFDWHRLDKLIYSYDNTRFYYLILIILSFFVNYIVMIMGFIVNLLKKK